MAVPDAEGRPVKTALMQPYLFPYVGYLQLISAVNSFVLFDSAQYLRRGWMHRNRILAAGGGWRWIGLAVSRAPRETPMSQMVLSPEVDLRARFLDALAPYERVAAHHDVAVDLIDRWAAATAGETGLVSVVGTALELTCELLDLPFSPLRATTLAVSRPSGAPVSGWAVSACRATGASTYVNAAGGRALYPASELQQEALGLAFVEPTLSPYDRGPHVWEPGLSILDVVAFAGPTAAGRMAREVSLDQVVAPRR
jgi:hypothetical protein